MAQGGRLMTALARIVRAGRRVTVELPAGVEVEGDSLRLRREGRTLVLEPLD